MKREYMIAARKIAKKTQQQVADYLMISRNSYNAIETGRTKEIGIVNFLEIGSFFFSLHDRDDCGGTGLAIWLAQEFVYRLVLHGDQK